MKLEIVTFLMAGVLEASSRQPWSEESFLPGYARYNFIDSEILKALSHGAAVGENLVFSPLSVKQVLGMMEEGASGETKSVIRRVLRLPPNDRFGLTRPWTLLKASAFMRSANAIFLSSRLVANASFAGAVRNSYGGHVFPANFERPRETATDINNWVREATGGVIGDVIGNPDRNTKGIIVNAVHFRARWLTSFPKEWTRVSDFETRNGDRMNAEMMSTHGNYPYAYVAELQAAAVELPYESPGFSMIVILPDELGTNRLIDDLVHVPLSTVVDSMREKSLRVDIPVMRIRSRVEMKPVLSSLGLSLAFSPEANYSKIAPGAGIESFRHFADIAVDEEGTVAASVTGASVVLLMKDAAEFIANRPFLFFVYMRGERRVIFAGKFEVPDKYAQRIQAGIREQPRRYNRARG